MMKKVYNVKSVYLVFFLLAGSVPSNNELSGKSIDKMNPSSRDDFDTFEALLKEKITQYEVKHLLKSN